MMRDAADIAVVPVKRDVRGDAQTVRVLVIAPSMRILGGQAVQAERLIDSLAADASLKVDFLPINPRLPEPFGRLQDITYVRTIITTALFILMLFWRVWRFDVVHIFSASYLSFLMAQTPAILVSRLYRRRTLLNYHSGEAADHLARWRRTAIPVMRMCDRIVVPSQYLVDVFARFGLQAEAIYNVVNSEQFHYREHKPLRPVFFANRNLEPHYAVGTILRGFAVIQRAHSEASLTIAGDGSRRAELERLSGELNLRNVRFLGAVPATRMPALYGEADIYLNASEIDNMPLSILEAYAAGTPIVTTDAGGIPYILFHEETGLLVPVGDHEAMAREALRLLSDEPLALRLARGGHAECAKYTAERTSREWSDLYHALAATSAHAITN